MTTFTPTTDEVRRVYVGEPQHFMDGLVGAEFDRWLESVKAEAWDEGAEEAWGRSTPDVNGMHYRWRSSGEPYNPYRIEQNSEGNET